MNKINTFVFMILAFILPSCGEKSKIKKGSTVKLSFLDNGKISQSGSKKVEQHRLFFSYSSGKTVYSGNRKVHSYKAVNKDSLPEEQKPNYYGFLLYNKNQNLIHKGLLPKSHFWKSFEKRPEYLIGYTGTFFLDIPISIDLDDIFYFTFVDLKDDKVKKIGFIEEPLKMYKNKEPEEKIEGWNQELFIHKIYGSSNPENAFDFVLLTEGFTKEELQADNKESLMKSKFGNYVKKYVLPLLETEPYKSRKNNINIWVVATPSKDSGVSNPFRNKSRNTVYRASYGAHCLEWSLIVRDQVRALEMASLTPFDQIIVLVNDETYGGQGSDIATFSMNKKAPYLIKHELAHAVGMMADEYKRYDEAIAGSTCENTLLESFVYHIHKFWGRNTYYENESYLAPNISNIADPSKIKWKDFLNEESPIVYFNYSEKALEFDKESFSLKGKYKSQFDKEKALITFGVGQSQSARRAVEFIKKVIVNDKSEPFDIYQKEDQFFIKLPNFSLEKDQVVTLELVLKDNSETRAYETFFEDCAKDYHFVTMPSRDFTGKATEVGIFQGSSVDIYKTFRSSYNNIMMSQNFNFDPWQEYSYGLIIDSYISKANNH